MGKYNIVKVYDEIRIYGRKISWVRIIWDYINIFRYSIVVNFIIQNKLFTVENLLRRGV